MENMPKMGGDQTPGAKREIPTTLPGLLRVLLANGKLAEFSAEAQKINVTVKDSSQKTEALAELAERFTKAE